MLRQSSEYTHEHEKALADGVREIASELRLIDAADLIAFLHTGQFGNLRSLINASTEMYFKPGSVSFGLSGWACVNWDSPPRIVLNMEFHHRKVDVFFRLVLENEEAGVEIDYISFGNKGVPAEETGRRLTDAIADARIPLMSALSQTFDGPGEPALLSGAA
ncbi:MAG: hypothetical protein P8Y36_10880 [Alphaproteobacteria bacterium]